MIVVYAGTEAEAREALAPILALDPPAQMIAEMPYAEIQSAIDDPPGYRNYWSAEHLREFPDEAVDVFCARAHDMVVPVAVAAHRLPLGRRGRPRRRRLAAAAPRRAAGWSIRSGSGTDPADDDRARAWARGTCEGVRPWATGGVYLNFVGDEGQDRVVEGYGRENYDRLAAVKAEFDPDDVFHLHHNIRPLPGRLGDAALVP